MSYLPDTAYTSAVILSPSVTSWVGEPLLLLTFYIRQVSLQELTTTASKKQYKNTQACFHSSLHATSHLA